MANLAPFLGNNMADKGLDLPPVHAGDHQVQQVNVTSTKITGARKKANKRIRGWLKISYAFRIRFKLKVLFLFIQNVYVGIKSSNVFFGGFTCGLHVVPKTIPPHKMIRYLSTLLRFGNIYNSGTLTLFLPI
jgi:hypothetical protein